ncbi:hypothetical protein MHYP_G00031210 [Metynnis hypsauchen]
MFVAHCILTVWPLANHTNVFPFFTRTKHTKFVWVSEQGTARVRRAVAIVTFDVTAPRSWGRALIGGKPRGRAPTLPERISWDSAVSLATSNKNLHCPRLFTQL